MRQYTTIEQSKRLLELGLSPETADMCWDTQDGSKSQVPLFGNPDEYECSEDFIPMWSLGALLDMMPYEITEDGDTYRLLVTHNLVQYPRLTTLWPSLNNQKAETTIDAAYDMIVWLLENEYIK